MSIAYVKISELPEISSSISADILPIVHDDETYKISVSNLIGNISSSSSSNPIISKTYSELNAIIVGASLSAGASLTAGQVYYVSDRKIYLTAITTNQFASDGIYEYTKGKKSWCAFNISGSVGSVDSVSINSVELLSTPVEYTTTYQVARIDPGWVAPPKVDDSLIKLCQAIVANINANASVNTTYKAYAIYNNVVIEAVNTGTELNTATLTAVGTHGLTCNTIQNMAFGTADLIEPLLYQCTYDFPNDILLGLKDSKYNNEVKYELAKVLTSTYDESQIFEFNWNDDRAINNKLVDCIITKNFLGSLTPILISGNDFISSEFGNNIILSGEVSNNILKYGILTYNIITSMYGGGGIVGNNIIGQSINVKSEITENSINALGISQNRLYSGASIKYCHETSAYGMVSNELEMLTTIWNVSKVASFKGNKLMPRGMLINIVSSDGHTIFDGNYFMDDFNFSNINFGGNYNYFINNRVSGIDTNPHDSLPTFQTLSNVGIANNNFGAGNYFFNNDLYNVDIIDSVEVNMYNQTIHGTTGLPTYYSTQNYRAGGRVSYDITFYISPENSGSLYVENYKLFSTIKSGFVFDSGYIYVSELEDNLIGLNNIEFKLGLTDATSSLFSDTMDNLQDLKRIDFTFNVQTLPQVSDDFTHVVMNISTVESEPITLTGWIAIHLEGFKYNTA